jgi:hypothetical protein
LSNFESIFQNLFDDGFQMPFLCVPDYMPPIMKLICNSASRTSIQRLSLSTSYPLCSIAGDGTRTSFQWYKWHLHRD